MSIKGKIEAIIYAAEEPVTLDQIAEALKEAGALEQVTGPFEEGSPRDPKSSGVFTNPRPNRCCQIRFTATRLVRGLAGSTSHRARSRRFEA